MRKILHDNRGESIVEVLVSFVMLLIIVGAFTTAIRGANLMMTRAGEIRKEAFNLELDLQGKLYPVGGGAPAITGGTGKTYAFTQTNPSGSGNFTIEAQLDNIEAEAGETTHLFPEYSAKDTP